MIHLPASTGRAAGLVAILAAFGAAQAAPAQTLQIIHSFKNDANGAVPRGTLEEVAPGVLMGATSGGSPGATVFAISGAGGFRTVATFNPNTQGYLSIGQPFQASNGLLYGVNISGNGAYPGSIFAVSTSGTVLIPQSAAFNASPLIEASDGNLYGVEGNQSTGDYSVFRMTLSGQLTDLYDLGPNAQSLRAPAPGERRQPIRNDNRHE